MAAGTRQGGGNRLFLQTCKSKDGKPFLGRYLKEVPSPTPAGWVLDSTISKAGKVTNFQRFDFVTGYLKSIYTEVEQILGKDVKKLNIVLADDDHSYQIDMGTVSGAYSRQFLQRVLNPTFNPDGEITVEVYSFQKDDKTLGTSLSLSQGDVKIGIKDAEYKLLPFITAMPEGKPVVLNGDKVTDYTDQIAWLFKSVVEKLPADLFEKKAPAQATTPVAEQAPVPPPPPVDDSDLPF